MEKLNQYFEAHPHFCDTPEKKTVFALGHAMRTYHALDHDSARAFGLKVQWDRKMVGEIFVKLQERLHNLNRPKALEAAAWYFSKTSEEGWKHLRSDEIKFLFSMGSLNIRR
jgi:hypothetical protein